MKYASMTIITLILLAGCASNDTQPVVKKNVQQVTTNEDTNTSKVIVPKKDSKEIKLKEVEDTNFNDAYMYPADTVKKEKEVNTTPSPITSDTMNKEECITMISQEKFDKYAAMFGSESASIKRCNMLKAMSH